MKNIIISMTFIFSLIGFAKTVTIMNYNVENLFDTVHDEGKTDYTYLPYDVKKKSPKIQKYCLSLSKKSWRNQCLYTDWNKSVLKSKLKNIAKVLNSYKGGADIIVLQEVENKNVLKMLVRELGANKYRYYSLLEGPDSRGIDNGVISKYPIKSSKLHKVDLRPSSNRPTRDILETRIDVDGKEISLFANHWPSQGGPSILRELAAKSLIKVSKNSKSDLTIALGDFNTLKADRPHGIKNHILKYYYDAHVEALNQGARLRDGSHWYKGEWSRLDRLFVLKTSKVNFDFRGFDIHSKNYMFKDLEWTDYNTGEVTIYKNVPYRFDEKEMDGFSDHLPLVYSFNL